MSTFGIPTVSEELERDLTEGLVKVENLLASHIKGSIRSSKKPPII